MADAVVIGRVAVKILPDTSKFREEAQAKLTKIEKKLKATVKLKVDLDKESARRVKERLDKIDAKAKVKAELNERSKLTVQARLAALARDRFVTIIPRVSKAGAANVATTLAALSGGRAIGSIFSDLGDLVKDADKAIPKIAALGSAIFTLGALGLTSASNLLAFVGSLVAIAPAALALPGILAGVGIGIGITMIAFKDFKKVLPDVAAQYKKMRLEVSANFWKGAKNGIRELVTLYLPHLAKVAEQVGSFWGKMASELAKPLKTALPKMMSNLSASIKLMTSFTPALSGIVTKLGLAGSEYLPRLANWLGKAATRFDSWLGKGLQNGDLKKFVDAAIEQLHQLGRVIGNLGGIFAGLAKAAEAAGGSTLTMVADTLERVKGVVNSAGFQKGLTQVFAAAHKALSDIAFKSGPGVERFFQSLPGLFSTIASIAGPAIGTALGAIADALANPAFQSGLVALFQGIGALIDGLAPAMPAVAAGLGALGKVLGDLMTQLGPTLGIALGAVADALVALSPLISSVVDLLGPLLRKAIEWIAPKLKAAADVIGGFSDKIRDLSDRIKSLPKDQLIALGVAVGAFAAILLLPEAALTTLVVAIAGAVAYLGVAYASFDGFRNLIASAWSYMQPGIEAIKSAFADVGAKALELWVAVQPVIQGIVDVIASKWPQIQQVAKAVWDTIVAIVQFNLTLLAAIITTATNAIKAIWSVFGGAIKTILGGELDNVMGIVRAALAIIKGIFQAGTAILKGDWKGAWDAIVGIVRGVGSGLSQAASGLVQIIKGVFQGAGSFLLQAGKDIVGGLIDGLTKRFKDVQDTLGRLTSKLPDWKGPAPKDRVLLKPAGQLIMQGLVDGLESGMKDVRSFLRSATTEIASTDFALPNVTVGSVQQPAVSSTTLTGSAGGLGGNAPTVHNEITIPVTGSETTPEDVADALLFATRRIANGGLYAGMVGAT